METRITCLSFGDRSCGVPTRWGNQLNGNSRNKRRTAFGSYYSPHSLGKSVEWKPDHFFAEASRHLHVPTRWGNQLNGNLDREFVDRAVFPSPHSLGKSVEWKLIAGNRLS